VKVLAAGAPGFVGRRRCPVLAAAGHHVVATTRTRPATPGELVRATGPGMATVYRLYPTEDALVAAYLRRLAVTIGAAIGEEITARDPGGALLAILDAIEADLSRPGFRGCPFNNASIEFDDPQHPARVEARPYRQQLLGTLSWLAVQLARGDGGPGAGGGAGMGSLWVPSWPCSSTAPTPAPPTWARTGPPPPGSASPGT